MYVGPRQPRPPSSVMSLPPCALLEAYIPMGFQSFRYHSSMRCTFFGASFCSWFSCSSRSPLLRNDGTFISICSNVFFLPFRFSVSVAEQLRGLKQELFCHKLAREQAMLFNMRIRGFVLGAATRTDPLFSALRRNPSGLQVQSCLDAENSLGAGDGWHVFFYSFVWIPRYLFTMSQTGIRVIWGDKCIQRYVCYFCILFLSSAQAQQR